MFKTTAKQEELRQKVRDFAHSELKPVVFHLDHENISPQETLYHFGRLGLFGIPYPQEYGGLGMDNVSYMIAIEELAREDGGTAATVLTHTSLGAYPVYIYGTEAQKAKYLAPMAKGEVLAGFAMTESNAGSDVAAMETTAVLEGSHYRLNGSKLFVTNAPLAHVYLVFAVTTPDIGVKGISAFIVEKDWKGISFSETYEKMGLRSSMTADLNFHDVMVPKANLLGEEGEGFKIAMSALDGGRIAVGAQALGMAEVAFDQAVEYSKDRRQFNKSICMQQAVAFKLAEMATKLRCAKMLIYNAADLKDNNLPYAMDAAMAKSYATEVCLEVADQSLQVFGGIGYLKGMDVERIYRDAKALTFSCGTNEVQKKFIANQLIGPMAKERVALRKTKHMGETGERKGYMLDGSPEQQVEALLEALVAEGYDFTVGIPMDTPVADADRIISVGNGIGCKENMAMIEELAKQAGACLGATRPIVETLGFLPLSRYVGISGQKFVGNLYIACGISGSSQHLKGVKDATTIVAINSNPEARIFRNADYGIVGDLEVILPLLAKSFDTGEDKLPAPPMEKMKKAGMKKAVRTYPIYVCSGCGYEYNQTIGDPENEVLPGTGFHQLSRNWVCPECTETKNHFIEI